MSQRNELDRMIPEEKVKKQCPEPGHPRAAAFSPGAWVQPGELG